MRKPNDMRMGWSCRIGLHYGFIRCAGCGKYFSMDDEEKSPKKIPPKKNPPVVSSDESTRG
jgi:hypothetical protein